MKPSFDVDGDAPPQMNWRSLFASEEDQSLHFFPPHFGSLQRLIKQIWGRCGEIAIHPTSENLLIFQFACEENCTWILKNGPWHIQNKPIILQRWTPNLKSLDFGMDSLPILVHLYGVLLEVFTSLGISYISSVLGSSLHMDAITAGRHHVSFEKGYGVVVAPPPSAVDIASCSHVFASNVNEVVAIGTSLPIEVVGCESGLIDVVSIDLVVGIVDGNVEFGSIDIVSTELAAGNVVAGNVSNVLVNVELVVGAVEAYIALSVDVSYVMPDQSIHALPVASTKLKKNSKKSGKKGKRKVRVKNTRAELERIQLLILSSAFISQLLEQEKSVSLELWNLLRVEESFYKRKARVSWGQSLHTYDQIVEEDVGFFTKLLGVSNPNVSGCSVELLQDRLCSSFSDEACNAFQSEISREEIKIALFEQKSDKVPGADGFSA
ncbi:hypothetical protein V6N13_069128 [Hibiscus sabdariffa]